MNLFSKLKLMTGVNDLTSSNGEEMSEEEERRKKTEALRLRCPGPICPTSVDATVWQREVAERRQEGRGGSGDNHFLEPKECLEAISTSTFT